MSYIDIQDLEKKKFITLNVVMANVAPYLPIKRSNRMYLVPALESPQQNRVPQGKDNRQAHENNSQIRPNAVAFKVMRPCDPQVRAHVHQHNHHTVQRP